MLKGVQIITRPEELSVPSTARRAWKKCTPLPSSMQLSQAPAPCQWHKSWMSCSIPGTTGLPDWAAQEENLAGLINLPLLPPLKSRSQGIFVCPACPRLARLCGSCGDRSAGATSRAELMVCTRMAAVEEAQQGIHVWVRIPCRCTGSGQMPIQLSVSVAGSACLGRVGQEDKCAVQLLQNTLSAPSNLRLRDSLTRGAWFVFLNFGPPPFESMLMLSIPKTLWQGVPQLNKALHEE